MRQSHHRGFSLIELMVVVAILSVAGALFVPRFLRHQTEKKQEECHKNLRTLLAAERRYFQKNNLYAADLEALGWRPEGKGWHEYRFLPAAEGGFLFQCIGNIDKDPTLDQATINETGRITQVSDDARQ